MRYWVLLLVLLLLPIAARGQTSTKEVLFVTANPSTCTTTRLYYNRTNQTLWGNSGTGTGCTNVSAGGGGGDVSGPASSVDNEIALFSGTGGKTVKRASLTASIVKLTAGVASAAGASDLPSAIDAAKVADGSVTNAEFQRLDATSSIQTQIDGKQPLDSDLTAIAGLTATTDNFIVSVSSAWASRSPAQVKTTLSLDNVDNTSDVTKNAATVTLTNKTISGASNTLTNLPAANISGVIPIANLATGTPDGSKFIRDDGTLQAIPGGGDALVANPLSQFAATTSDQLATVLSNESGTAGGFVRATGASLDSPAITTPTGIVKGDVGLGNVDNTSDANKPVSTATQTALDLKANLASPTFTGTVTIPTPFTLGAVSVLPTGTELNFVDGVTSAIQTQLDAKAPSTRTISTTSPLAGGGDLSANRTLTCTTCVTSASSLTSTAIMTGAGSQGSQTPAATATLDSSGNISTPGTITSGAGGSTAGALDLGEGTAPSLVANTFSIYAPTDVAAGGLALVLPAAAFTGLPKWTNSSGVMTASQATAGTDYTTPSSTETLTNKTLDAAGTGNVFTSAFKTWFAAAGCNNATASSFWDLGTSLAPTPTCKNSSSGAAQNASLDFPDSDGMFFAQSTMMLADDFTGTVDAKVRWLAAATSGDVIWNVSTICVADGETDNPAFNAVSSVTDTAKGTTLQSNDATITTVTITGCAAGELMHLKVSRDRTTSGDTITGVVSLLGLELTTRRAQ